MTDLDRLDELETRLTATMRAHEPAAPTPDEVSVRAYRVRTSRTRRRVSVRTWAVAAFSACAVAIGGGTVSYLATRSVGGSSGAGGGSISGPEAIPQTLYVIGGRSGMDVFRPDTGLVTWTTTTGTGGGAAALRSLFRLPSTATRFNGWAGERLLGLSRSHGHWVVDVSRVPTVRRSGDRARYDTGIVLQQVAWTLADAVRQETARVRVEVKGRPLTTLAGQAINGDGLPLVRYLADGTQESNWVDRSCGTDLAVAVDGTQTAVAPPSVARLPGAPYPTRVTMRVGQTLRWLPDGLCFVHPGLTVRRDGPGGPGRVDGMTWIAPAPGTYRLSLGGDAAGRMCDFVGTDCAAIDGPLVTFGAIRVRVTG